MSDRRQPDRRREPDRRRSSGGSHHGTERRRSRRRVYASRRPRWIRTIVTGVVILGAAVALGLLYFGYLPNVLDRTTAADTVATDSAAQAIAAMTTPRLAEVQRDDMQSDGVRRADANGEAVPTSDDSLTVAAPDSAVGDDVYRRVGRCLGCHGTDAEGTPSLAPSLRTASPTTRSLAAIRDVVANGRPSSMLYPIAMPAYNEQLTPAQIANVAAFIYALSHPGRVVAAHRAADSGAASSKEKP